jgi:hypothetical protein
MRFGFGLAVLAALAVWATTPAQAKDAAPKYKTIEAKHFDRAEGVELMPEFGDYLDAELRAQLAKTKLFGQVLGQGEVVEAADATSSVVVMGTLTEYKKGSVLKSRLIGYGAGSRSLKVQVNVERRSDQKNLAMLHVQVRCNPSWNEKVLAKEAAKVLAKEIKNSLEHQEA